MSEVKRKKIRARALRLRRALLKEQENFGEIDDGAGKRYLIGPLFVQCGDMDSALSHYAWFEEHCPDDGGDPIHYLFWALALYRAGNMAEARVKLMETLIQNIYLLPALLGLPAKLEDIWHSSNLEDPDYITYVAPEFIPTLSKEERSWIEGQLESDRFRALRSGYVATYQKLKYEHNYDARWKILDGWDKLRHRLIKMEG